MKILILSCYTGEGHNSAAYAIEEALIRRGIECEVADPVSFHSRKAQNIVSSAYNNLIRKTPKLFGIVYKIGEIYSNTGIVSPVYAFNSTYAKKLCKYITDNKFDAVISTHIYGMEAITAVNKKFNLQIPNYGVMTDYTNTPFFSEAVLQTYFVPHEKVKHELVDKGIPEKYIVTSGIPVSKKFNEHIPKDEARDILSIPHNKKIYLLMCGGVGCENIISLCKEFLKSDKTDFILYVLVGRNSNLSSKLNSRFANDPRLKAVNFTKRVNLYMNAADVLISKPGGLSSTEAAVANIPIVHFGAIPGCESKNVRFFSKRGLSVWAKSKKDVTEWADKLSSNHKLSERMLEAQRAIINQNAADDIAEHIAGK